jgi:ATP-dependent Clp protease ATP-binding subunit ClpB
MAWEGAIGAVDAARVFQQQVVESEHLMKALLEQKDGLARRIFTKAGLDKTSVLQATDDFISKQPKVGNLMIDVFICAGLVLIYLSCR